MLLVTIELYYIEANDFNPKETPRYSQVLVVTDPNIMILVTARIRSAREGNAFSLSVQRGDNPGPDQVWRGGGEGEEERCRGGGRVQGIK